MLRGLFALFLIVVLLALTQVHATPLDAATCGLLKGEQAILEQGGARSSMAKGPEWAKTNLPADKLTQVRRLIELDAQLLFRCSGQTLVELPASVEADPAATAPDAKEEGKETPSATPAPKADAPPAAAKKTPVAKSPPAAKASPAHAPTAKTSPAGVKKEVKEPAKQTKEPAKAPPPAKAAAKPAAKAKVDDAYKPPPPDPAVNPFAGQKPLSQ